MKKQIRFIYKQIKQEGDWKHGILESSQDYLIAKCNTLEDAKALILMLNYSNGEI